MKKNILNDVSGMIIMLFALFAIPAQAQDNEAYAVLDDSGTLTFYYDALKATRPGTRYGMPANDSEPAWAGTFYTLNTTITKAVFDSSFADFKGLKSMRSWFLWCDALKEVQNLENINTENLTSIRSMFYGCTSLQVLDFSKFKTSNITSMRSMFLNCYALTTLALSNFDTSKVTDMSHMFYGCYKLSTICCNDTWTCQQSESMFAQCYKLKGAVEQSYYNSNVSMANPETGYFTLGGKIPASAYATLTLGANKGTLHGDVEIFTGVIDGDKLKLAKRDEKDLPAGASVLVKGKAGEQFTLKVDAKVTPTTMPDDNVLEGNTTPYTVEAGANIFALANIDGKTAFYRVEAGVTIPAHRAWLNIPSSGVKILAIDFEGETTVLDAVEQQPQQGDAIYNLAGQRVDKMRRGIYIVNGKKVIKR